MLHPMNDSHICFFCECVCVVFFWACVSGQTALSEVAQLFMYRMSKIDLSDEFTGDPSLAESGPAPLVCSE